VDTQPVDLLETSTVELQRLEARSDAPDVCEGDRRELTTPLSGDADAAAEGHDEVAELLPAVEAFVGVLPHAVDGVGAFRFCQDIFEGDPDVFIDAVWVTVN